MRTSRTARHRMGSGGFAGYGIHLNYRSGLNVAETDWARAKLDGVRKFARLFANQDLITEDEVPRAGAWVADYAQKGCPGGGIGLYLYTQLNAMADRQRATK